MGSPLNLFLFYILISLTPLRQKSCILTDGWSVRNLPIDDLQFSRKLLNNFSQDTFAALRIVFKDIFKKTKISQIGNFCSYKISNNCFEKNQEINIF